MLWQQQPIALFEHREALAGRKTKFCMAIRPMDRKGIPNVF
jgi:hypothetical protein